MKKEYLKITPEGAKNVTASEVKNFFGESGKPAYIAIRDAKDRGEYCPFVYFEADDIGRAQAHAFKKTMQKKHTSPITKIILA